MTTSITNLPKDLIEEIISRVPLKTMKAVRLTCKTWNNLSKSESLRKATSITREGETMMIAIRNHKLYLMSVFVDNVNPSMELKGQLSFVYDEISITEVLHFEGLLLFILRDVTRIVVWNPYWGQTVWIKLRYSHNKNGYDRLTYALGYEDKESCRAVKLLRFIDYFSEAPERQFFWYEIYDFDSGLWTTLDVTPHWHIYCSHGVSLKGNTYWLANKRSSEGYLEHIIGFDFTRERFGPLLPMPAVDVRDHDEGHWTLSCVKDEKLVALFQYQDHYAPELEIWITTKINVEMVSWSKFLRMDRGPKIEVPDTFFNDEEKKVFMDFNRVYDSDDDYLQARINIIGEAGYLKRMKVIRVPGNQNCMPIVCSYVPSLIQISKPSRGKRIKESRLEKRRFNQNRSKATTEER